MSGVGSDPGPGRPSVAPRTALRRPEPGRTARRRSSRSKSTGTATASATRSTACRAGRDLALADLHVDRVDEHHRVNRVQRPRLPFRHPVHHPVGNGADRLLRDLGPVNLLQVRRDLPVREAFRGQGNHHVLDPGKPPLPFRDDLRLEAGIPVPRHAYFHRPGLGEHRLRPVPVPGIPAVPPVRGMLFIAQVIVQLAFQGTLDHHLGQLPEQAAVTGQLQPAGPRPLGELPQQLLISRRQPARLLPGVRGHVCHLVSPPSRKLHRCIYSPAAEPGASR